MKFIVCKYRVLLEYEPKSYELRVYPIASCELMNQQVTKLTVCEAAS